MKTIKIFSVLSLLLIFSNNTLSQEKSELLPDGQEIAKKINERNEGEFVTRNLKMELTSKSGKKRLRETKGFRKYYGEEKKTAIFYLSPKNIKDTAFLTFDYPNPDIDDDQWLYLPALRKVRRISASDRGDYFLGTDFTYEDIKLETRVSLDEYTRKAVGVEKFDGHDCYVIESYPVSDEVVKELGYSKIKSWVDKDIWITRKSVYWDTKGNLLKTTEIKDIRLVQNIWTAHQIKVENHKTGHKTLFTFSDIDYKTPIKDEVFSEVTLRKGI